MNIKLIILTAIVALVLSLFNSAGLTQTKEGFWGGIQLASWATPEVVKPNGHVSAVQGTLVGVQQQHDFVSVPSFQSMLSPRMGISQGIGTFLRYNPPPQSMSGIPKNPLGTENYTNMFEESYVPQGCNAAAQPPSNWNNQMNAMTVSSIENSMTDSVNAGVNALPIGTMDTMNSEGQSGQEVMMQRYMYSQPKDRLYAAGDFIRGDLPIVPDTPSCGQGWFNVYPRVNISLNPGAMNVLGGVSNDTSQALAALVNVASGGAKTTVGGVNLSDVNMVPQYKTSMLDSMRSPVVTSFP